MNRKIALGAAVAAVALLTLSAWLVYAQFSSLQAQIADLQAQNIQLEGQLGEVQNQTGSLESQNSELVRQLGDLTKQLALERHLSVEIKSLWHRDYWSAFGGLLVDYPFNVTVRNNDVITLSGVTLTVKTYSGIQEIGWTHSSEIDLLLAGEERVVSGSAVVPITAPSNLTYVATLKAADVVLDEFTLP